MGYYDSQISSSLEKIAKAEERQAAALEEILKLLVADRDTSR